MSIEFFQGFWTFKLDEKRLNKTLGSGRRGCKSSLIREGQLFTLTSVMKTLIYVVFWMLRRESKKKKKRSV